MVKPGAAGFVLLTVFAQAVPLSAQGEPAKNLQIRLGTLQRLPLVGVSFLLSTSEVPMFVPYCGKEESGEEVLCSLAAHLERQTPQGWRRALDLLKDAGFGLASKDIRKADGRLIPPRSKSAFNFYINTAVYLIPPGTRLRVVIDTWRDRESMIAGAPPAQLTSPEFICPPE